MVSQTDLSARVSNLYSLGQVGILKVSALAKNRRQIELTFAVMIFPFEHVARLNPVLRRYERVMLGPVLEIAPKEFSPKNLVLGSNETLINRDFKIVKLRLEFLFVKPNDRVLKGPRYRLPE
jgi:hypothetical protein